MIFSGILAFLLIVVILLFLQSRNRANYNALISVEKLSSVNLLLEQRTNELDLLKTELDRLNAELLKMRIELDTKTNLYQLKINDFEQLKLESENIRSLLEKSKDAFSAEFHRNQMLNEKLLNQQKEIEEMGRKFNLEFENIANKIFDNKTQKFTQINKENLSAILNPLSENLKEFKKQVEEVYEKESKERFSLGEKVKELAQLNQVISEEAKNLTKALKGEAKTQGRWGEMILEKILEMSGLRKGEEYFLEEQLSDNSGKAILSESEGKKMRPDAIVKYPDNRNVIIDSKVSLNAFSRYLEAVEVDVQKTELNAHLAAVKDRIVELSKRGYDDYDKSLDFVMMFIPSEPAYIAALQADPNLWNFAYEKRILLLNPTNLITSLKLIVDLWRKEYQNQNAQEIADRGAKLYDKFVGFVQNLDTLGSKLDAAREAYTDAYNQLSKGNDNLVRQTEKLKALGLKNKKELKSDLINRSTEE